jgi:Flp pilus assembly protein CpaB
MGVVVPPLPLYALLAWTGIAFLPLPKKSIRNGFIQDHNRKDCLRAVCMHVLILLLLVSGEIAVLLVT